MSTRGLIFIAGIIIGFFVGMLSFSSHGAGKVYGDCVYSCKERGSPYNIEQQKRMGASSVSSGKRGRPGGLAVNMNPNVLTYFLAN